MSGVLWTFPSSTKRIFARSSRRPARMRLEIVTSESPRNGRLPAAISSTTTPSEKISNWPSILTRKICRLEKELKTISVLILAISLAPSLPAQEAIALKGSVRPRAPLSVVGQKSMIAGTENGIFEAWIFPYQICHGFQLLYQNHESPLPQELAPLAQDIEVRPEATTITFSHPLFTVRETLFAPIDLPALVALLEIDGFQDLTIIASFFPDMEPMWPAGLGGQYAFWEEKSKTYVISESRRLRNAFIGAPDGKVLSAPLAHELTQMPNQFAFEFKRETARMQKFP